MISDKTNLLERIRQSSASSVHLCKSGLTGGAKGGLPKPSSQLKRMLSTALTQIAALWQPIAITFDWVHQVATLLNNDGQLDGDHVRHRLERLLQQMEHDKGQAGSLAAGVDHFFKVTRSYAPELFHCYDLAPLLPTSRI